MLSHALRLLLRFCPEFACLLVKNSISFLLDFRMFSLAGSPVTVAPNNKNMINFAIKDGKVSFNFHLKLYTVCW